MHPIRGRISSPLGLKALSQRDPRPFKNEQSQTANISLALTCANEVCFILYDWSDNASQSTP